MQEPVFTRYLYEYLHVKHSLAGALLDGEREEALFWAYELFHSGFQEDVWAFVREVYHEYYSALNPRYQSWLDKFYTEWKTTGNDCALGSAVGTLAIRKWKLEDSDESEKYIIVSREDRHKTAAPVPSKAYQYLGIVSKYGVRPEVHDTVGCLYGLTMESVREAYLGGNWLYYCRKSPVWFNRICIGRGMVDDLGKRVTFPSDDELEAFYGVWGLEPDEQCKEMHICHGIYAMKK